MLKRYGGFFQKIAVIMTVLILLSGVVSAISLANTRAGGGAALLTLLVTALSAYLAYMIYSAASAAFLALEDLTDRAERTEHALQEIRQALSGLSAPQQSPSVPDVSAPQPNLPASARSPRAAASRSLAPSGEKPEFVAVDRSQLIIRCPVCQMEQRSNRNLCFRCGTRFVDAAHTDA